MKQMKENKCKNYEEVFEKTAQIFLLLKKKFLHYNKNYILPSSF